MNDYLKALNEESGLFLAAVAQVAAQTIAESEHNAQLSEILLYPLKNKGHMLRPLLVYLTARSITETMTKEQSRDLVNLAASIELLHNASLVHDDMLDLEETRRGEACLYQKYGYRNAILAGNCYYIKALELSSRSLGSVHTEHMLQAAFRMCHGEMLQAYHEGKTLSEETYLEIIKSKTAALTALACRGTARILGESEELWEKAGEWMGIIYQMKDDVKDQDANLEPAVRLETNIANALEQMEALLCEEKCLPWRRQFIDLVRKF